MPISPHIGIYKPQITSVMSLMHRVTGIVLYFGLLLLLWSFILFVAGFDLIGDLWLSVATSFVFPILSFIWFYTLFFHLCAGIRYLFWGLGIGFDLKVVSCSAYLIIITSLIASGVVTFIITSAGIS